MSHAHFTLSERIRIQVGLEDNLTRQAIADRIGKSRNAVNDEITRNAITLGVVTTSRVNKPRIISLDLRTRRGKGEIPEKLAALASYSRRLARFARGQSVYDAEIAQTLYLARRSDASQSNVKLQDGNALTQRVTELLLSKDRDSPEQIAANLKKAGTAISHQTIYSWIHSSRDNKRLVKRLRRKGRRYRYAAETQLSWNKTKNKRSIHTRPAVVKQLTRYGDLEGDTIFGKDSKDRILSHVDRTTGLLSLSLILGYDSYKIYQQTLKDITRVFGNSVNTITYDNGSEFAAWKRTERQLGVTIYFADPYRSSQRGRNENANGLVRDYFPKGTDFKQITHHQLRTVETILNNRSRKRYDWRNPLEQRQLVLAATE
ncbi:MAG: IS30 family transposase [Candidatus Saccharimonadales bacterium]